MSFGIERQSDQYGAFVDDAGIYAARDHFTADVVVDDLKDFLAPNQITAGLLDTRHAYTGVDSYALPSEPEGYDPEGRRAHDEEYGHHLEAPEDPYGGVPPETPLQPLDDMLEHARRPLPYGPPPSFRSARRLEADGGLTAAMAPAQPAAPAAPVWLGHTYVPGQRVGLPYQGVTIPGTIVGLEGTNVAVLWDDHQFTVEEPAGIQPLY